MLVAGSYLLLFTFLIFLCVSCLECGAVAGIVLVEIPVLHVEIRR